MRLQAGCNKQMFGYGLWRSPYWNTAKWTSSADARLLFWHDCASRLGWADSQLQGRWKLDANPKWPGREVWSPRRCRKEFRCHQHDRLTDCLYQYQNLQEGNWSVDRLQRFQYSQIHTNTKTSRDSYEIDKGDQKWPGRCVFENKVRAK